MPDGLRCMPDGLRCGNELAGDVVRFLDDAINGRAVDTLRFGAVHLKDLFQRRLT
jgi:hypothetical protein